MNNTEYPKKYTFLVGLKYVSYLFKQQYIGDHPNALLPDERALADDFRDFCKYHYGRGFFTSDPKELYTSQCRVDNSTTTCVLVEYTVPLP